MRMLWLEHAIMSVDFKGLYHYFKDGDKVKQYLIGLAWIRSLRNSASE
jgi:hypothetical protein